MKNFQKILFLTLINDIDKGGLSMIDDELSIKIDFPPLDRGNLLLLARGIMSVEHCVQKFTIYVYLVIIIVAINHETNLLTFNCTERIREALCVYMFHKTLSLTHFIVEV